MAIRSFVTNKRNIGLISSVLAFGSSIIVSLFFSPIIINTLGPEAYGYATLATNIAYYFSLIGVAINSVGVRFVSVAWHDGNKKKAVGYYSAIVISNGIISLLLVVVGLFISFNISNLFSVSIDYIDDVKIAFFMAFVASAISVLTPSLNCGIYINDSIEVLYISTIVSQIIRLIIVFTLFNIDVKIYFISTASVICNVSLAVFLIAYNLKKIPELKVNLFNYSISNIKTIMNSGLWILGDTLSSMMVSGLSLVYANLFIDEQSMGVLSVSSSISSQFLVLVQYLTQLYTPQLLKHYSCNNADMLKDTIVKAQRLIGVIISLPLAGILVFGEKFYMLWLNGRSMDEIVIIQLLTIILVIPYSIFSTTQVFRQIVIVYNMVRVPTVVAFIIGILELGVMYALGETNNLNIVSLTIITSAAVFLREALANCFYAIRIANISLSGAIIDVGRILFFIIIIIIEYVLILNSNIIAINNWMSFIIVIVICGFTGLLTGFLYLKIIRKVGRKDDTY